MNPIVRILLGIGIMIVGFLMVYKTAWFLSMLGRVYWAEKNFGPGGTRLLYKLFGIGVTFIGIIVVTDLWDILIGGFLTGLFGG